ncbi:tetraacyldisaccharide 4'-kinase [Vibrio algarum]|uniref:Tetraacyldisaccharide 4'-kinase n=1 Tax=Vibrio algarum TaxID=3020714 RepID=A0ABT4YPZ8_9VIBR|nr:tetraacyldisaccharide 4'-kinase [Vibrio sp. KJ40-1]MDB1123573.1 tetraacyldisaccharide 4'-kinase [Vibrio sp. KJ40-1]
MIEKIWFENHFLGLILWPILWPLSKIFKWVASSRRDSFLQNNSESYRSPFPIVVVGNITAGGNGKTPVVIWLVEKLQELGLKPAVVSRGYGGKAKQYPLIVNDTTSTKECGDEPKLIFRRTGVPVVVDPVRSNAVKKLIDSGIDIVIADDGLQHYALARDIEFVVVDGQRRFGNESFIPLGPLREGLERLDNVDFVINNGGQVHEGEMAMTLSPGFAKNLVTGEERMVTELDKLVAFAAIGNPHRFFKTLHSLGADVVKTRGFIDHQDFKESELFELQQFGSNMIMTEKDAVKCSSYAKENWWYLPVTACFSQQEEKQILDKIINVRNEYGSPSA